MHCLSRLLAHLLPPSAGLSGPFVHAEAPFWNQSFQGPNPHGGYWVTSQKFNSGRELLRQTELGASFGLDDKTHWSALRDYFLGVKSFHPRGNWASNYAGHQFGRWAGQLGDGRAHILGAFHDLHHKRWEWQAKGLGPSPYSRGADGLAVLRSSFREWICSEYFAACGIPTTRALALLATQEPVLRDPLYDGHPRWEPGAVCIRLAPHFVRFGHFELWAARQDQAKLQELWQWVFLEQGESFPHPENQAHEFGVTLRSTQYISSGKLQSAFCLVADLTLSLVEKWMSLGFVHGVMNTDNMSILGITLDFGPFGFLGPWDPSFTSNTSDREGRYAWGKQRDIALWNLARLAESWVPLGLSPQWASEFLRSRWIPLEELEMKLIARKLGIPAHRVTPLFPLLKKLKEIIKTSTWDWTLFFKWLELIHHHHVNLDSSKWGETDFNLIDQGLSLLTHKKQKISTTRQGYKQLFSLLQSLKKDWFHLPSQNPWFIPRGHGLQTWIQKLEQSLNETNEDAGLWGFPEDFPELAKPFDLSHLKFPKDLRYPSKPLSTQESKNLNHSHSTASWQHILETLQVAATHPDWGMPPEGSFCERLSCSS